MAFETDAETVPAGVLVEPAPTTDEDDLDESPHAEAVPLESEASILARYEQLRDDSIDQERWILGYAGPQGAFSTPELNGHNDLEPLTPEWCDRVHVDSADVAESSIPAIEARDVREPDALTTPATALTEMAITTAMPSLTPTVEPAVDVGVAWAERENTRPAPTIEDVVDPGVAWAALDDGASSDDLVEADPPGPVVEADQPSRSALRAPERNGHADTPTHRRAPAEPGGPGADELRTHNGSDGAHRPRRGLGRGLGADRPADQQAPAPATAAATAQAVLDPPVPIAGPREPFGTSLPTPALIGQASPPAVARAPAAALDHDTDDLRSTDAVPAPPPGLAPRRRAESEAAAPAPAAQAVLDPPAPGLEADEPLSSAPSPPAQNRHASPPAMASTSADAPEAPADEDDPRTDATSEPEGQSGRFSLSGVAMRSGDRALCAVAPSAGDASFADPPRIRLSITGAVNCRAADATIMNEPGFAPSKTGFTIVGAALGPGPFMMSGTYHLSGAT